ncbi:MAG: hypothetical protein Q9166_001222 [cf. Caloplaca sp. 2 TL-2023]
MPYLFEPPLSAQNRSTFFVLVDKQDFALSCDNLILNHVVGRPSKNTTEIAEAPTQDCDHNTKLCGSMPFDRHMAAASRGEGSFRCNEGLDSGSHLLYVSRNEDAYWG